MKREVDVPKLIWRGVRLGAWTALLTLILLWVVAACLRWQLIGENAGRIYMAAAVFLAAFAAQYADYGKEKGIASAIIGVLIFDFMLLLMSAGMPHTAVKASALLYASLASITGSMAGLLLHFNKTDSRRKNKIAKYN